MAASAQCQQLWDNNIGVKLKRRSQLEDDGTFGSIILYTVCRRLCIDVLIVAIGQRRVHVNITLARVRSLAQY